MPKNNFKVMWHLDMQCMHLHYHQTCKLSVLLIYLLIFKDLFIYLKGRAREREAVRQSCQPLHSTNDANSEVKTRSQEFHLGLPCWDPSTWSFLAAFLACYHGARSEEEQLRMEPVLWYGTQCMWWLTPLYNTGSPSTFDFLSVFFLLSYI